jgi:hypothetical protein
VAQVLLQREDGQLDEADDAARAEVDAGQRDDLVEREIEKKTVSQTGWPWVDVIITNFGNFCQFPAKKIGVFTTTNVTMKFLKKTSGSLSKKTPIFFHNFLGDKLSKKRQYFCLIFGR